MINISLIFIFYLFQLSGAWENSELLRSNLGSDCVHWRPAERTESNKKVLECFSFLLCRVKISIKNSYGQISNKNMANFKKFFY